MPSACVKSTPRVKEVSHGVQLIFIADDPAAPLDFAHFCETSGHKLCAQETKWSSFHFTIEKQG